MKDISRLKRNTDTLTRGGYFEILEIVDNFPFYVLLVDGEYRILLVNRALREHLGKHDELVGKNCLEVMYGESEPLSDCPLQEAIERNQTVEREIFHPNTGRWLLSTACPLRLRTPEGRPIFLFMVRDITEKKQKEEQLVRREQTQTALNALLDISLRDIPLEEQLNLILKHIISLSWLALEQKGSIFLVEDDPKTLVMKAHNNFSSSLLSMCKRVPFGRCLCGRAALSGKIVFANCIDERHENRYPGISPHGHYCVPIVSEGKVIGVINLYVKERHIRDEKDVEFLYSVGVVVAGIVKREQLKGEIQRNLQNLQRAMDGVIELTGRMVEMKDLYTAGHQRRVTKLACAIAQEMNLPAEQIERIKIAGMIHDLGKLFVPADILSKSGPLSEIEYKLIKMHPQNGYQLLKTIEYLRPVAQIILQHHERWNGSGYPSGLRGEEIQLEARILGVADVVEAISSHRPHRPAQPIEKALKELLRNKGVLYDPKVVDACVKTVEKGFKF